MYRAAYEIEVNQQVVMVKPIGGWDARIANEYIQAVNGVMPDINFDFCCLIDLRRWELGTPEALQLLHVHQLNAIEKGYKLEFHYGEPLAVPMQISRQKITPANLTLVQTNSIDQIAQYCVEFDYQFNDDALVTFLR